MLLQLDYNIIVITNEKGGRFLDMKKKLISILLSFTMIGLSLSPVKADLAAGKKFKVTYTHSKKTYTKKAIAARSGSSIISSPMPGYIYQSNSMYSGYYLAKNGKKLGITYSYNKSSKKVTMKRGSKTLVMKVNSKKATLNGKSTTLSVPVRKTYYQSKKKNYIMIPGSSVASKLGLDYTWNNRLLSGIFEVPSSSNSSLGSGTSSTSSTVVNPKTKMTASASNYSIRIKKPSGLPTSDVSTDDDYMNKRLIIKIRGSHKAHFSSSSNRTIKESFSSYSVTYSGGNTYIYMKTSSIRGFSITQDSSYIYVKYASPTSMYQNVLVIDAGHGGSDSGAVGNGLKEKDLTLSIVKQIKYYFDRNANFKVYYTRLTDVYPSLNERYNLANNVGAHRFLSVHINSASASAVGTETLYNPKGGSTGSWTGKKFATSIQTKLRAATGFPNRGLQQRIPGTNGVAVLTYTRMSAALGEVGFISNSSEAKYMKNNISKIGKSFYDGILSTY